jgi:hypothetical protein
MAIELGNGAIKIIYFKAKLNKEWANICSPK